MSCWKWGVGGHTKTDSNSSNEDIIHIDFHDVKGQWRKRAKIVEMAKIAKHEIS